MTTDDAEMKQNEFNSIFETLNNYFPKYKKYIEAKNSLINNVNNFQKGREKIIKGFKEGIFLLRSDDKFGDQQTSKKSTKEKEKSEKNKFFEHTENETKDIDYGLFNYYFNFVEPSDLAKKLFEIKDKKKNNDFVEEIKNRWSKLKDDIEEMPEEKRKNEKPNVCGDVTNS